MCQTEKADLVLNKYRNKIAQRTGLTFPKFCSDAVHTASFLAVLLTPGPGAVRTDRCCLNNDDPTAKRSREIIDSIGLPRNQIVFWNLYASFDDVKKNEKNRRCWAKKLNPLVTVMPNLKAVLAFGDEAWRGMRYLDIPRSVVLIGAPHPANKTQIMNPDFEKEIKDAWKRAQALLQ